MALNGTLIIAGPYDDGMIKSIHAHFRKLLDAEVEFCVRHDDSLIGGFIASIEGRLYDASIRSRVESLQHHLAE